MIHCSGGRNQDSGQLTIVFFLSAVFAVFSAPYRLFCTPPPPLNFSLHPPNFSLPILFYSDRSAPFTPPLLTPILRRYWHPFGYDRLLQLSHTSPPAFPPDPTGPPPHSPLCPTLPAIPPHHRRISSLTWLSSSTFVAHGLESEVEQANTRWDIARCLFACCQT